jgi:hypothetical protein
MLSLGEGRELISIARSSIETYLREGREVELPSKVPKQLLGKRGVFVTLTTYPSHELRGCIGLPYPDKELVRAVIGSALSAAFEDPRFHEIDVKELDKILVEVSVLTEPKKISVREPSEYSKKIVVGKDGLIVKYGWYTGLLLPQVPVEQGWTEVEFLENACMKAGLQADAWLNPKVEILSFQAQIFAEERPGGNVIEKKLKV